jgi:hypothetical protein
VTFKIILLDTGRKMQILVGFLSSFLFFVLNLFSLFWDY